MEALSFFGSFTCAIDLLEDHDEKLLLHVGHADRSHRHVRRLDSPVGFDLQTPHDHILVFRRRPVEGRPDLDLEPLPGHVEHVHAGLALRGFQELPRLAVDVEDIAALADDDRGGGEILQEHSPRDLREGDPLRLHRFIGSPCRAGSPDTKAGENARVVGGSRLRPPEDLPFPVECRKKLPEGPHGLGRAEEEDPARPQAVVEHGDELALQLQIQIDHQVAAAHQVELREGGVADHVLDGENHPLPDLAPDPEARFLLDEVPLEALGADIQGNVGGVEPGPRLGDGILVDVGAEDLHPEIRFRLLHALSKQDGDGVGLFPGPASRDPHPDGIRFGLFPDEIGQHFLLESFKRLGVPEEARHADEQLLEEDLDLLRVLLDILGIGGRIGDLVNAHAPLDPAQDRRLFVVGKIMARPRAQNGEDLLDGREARVAQVEDLPRLLRVILPHVGLQSVRASSPPARRNPQDP